MTKSNYGPRLGLSPRAMYFLDHVALYRAKGHGDLAAHQLAQADTAAHFGNKSPFVRKVHISDAQWDYDEERRSGWCV